MKMIKAEFTRLFAMGFVAGALLVAVTANDGHFGGFLTGQVLPPAVAAPAP